MELERAAIVKRVEGNPAREQPPGTLYGTCDNCQRAVWLPPKYPHGMPRICCECAAELLVPAGKA